MSKVSKGFYGIHNASLSLQGKLAVVGEKYKEGDCDAQGTMIIEDFHFTDPFPWLELFDIHQDQIVYSSDLIWMDGMGMGVMYS